MEPAPYGGFMTRTLDIDKQKKDLLAQQEVEVVVNGTTGTLRPNAVHVRGVDNLSTAQIEEFVNFYLNFDFDGSEYRSVADPVWFRVEWIDDSNANLVFNTHEDSLQALEKISEFWPSVTNIVDRTDENQSVFSQDYLDALVEEREARSYGASIPFYQHQKQLKELVEGKDLFAEKKAQITENKASEMEEDGSSVVLYIRQALQSDRKVRNAAAYSRYYLLHGEPDRTIPTHQRRNDKKGRGRGSYARNRKEEEEDLFAGKIKESIPLRETREDEEDLFASRLRERSPGR